MLLFGNCMGSISWEFRRGFLDVVEHEYGDWMDYAPRLVAAHPVRRATWKGKVPVQFGGTFPVWQWRRNTFAWFMAQYELPPEVFDRLPNVEAGQDIMNYTAAPYAVDALSEAMLAVARAANEKPAFPPREEMYRRVLESSERIKKGVT